MLETTRCLFKFCMMKYLCFLSLKRKLVFAYKTWNYSSLVLVWVCVNACLCVVCAHAWVYMYVRVRTHTYEYVCVSACWSLWELVCVCKHEWVCGRVSVCVCACTCVSMLAQVLVCMCEWLRCECFVHLSMHLCECVCVCTYSCMNREGIPWENVRGTDF